MGQDVSERPAASSTTSGRALPDEPGLIARAQAGDNLAWEALVRGHQEAAFRLAYLFLGNARDAEDVTQEAFIRALRALDRFDLARPFRPWLLSITANLARNRRRALGRYLAALRRLVQANPEPVSPAPDSQTASWEAQLLWQAVRRLSPIDQEVIYLRYYLGLSEAETAAALEVASGTVKSRLHRGLARLKTLAEREFPELREGHSDG